MTTAMAVPSTTAPPTTHSVESSLSPKSYPSTAPSAPSAAGGRASASAAPTAMAANPSNPSTSNAEQRGPLDAKRSPNSARNGIPPKIVVKKEPPSSPDLPTSRHRPRKLDLSKNTVTNASAISSRPSGGPLTARDSSGLAMHDVGLACLSPGFSTHDPTMREQLQRSISVRDQQRHIIESRLQKTAKPGDGGDGSKTGEHNNPFGGALKTPSTSRKKPPAGLSIVPPSHEQFANERVIQSAPLHQSFTGRHQPQPLTRHIANQPSNLSNTSHIHHVPATQTNNRLPPIADVFASEDLGSHRERGNRNGFYNSNSTSNSSHSNQGPPFPSPGQPSGQSQGPTSGSGRPRDYRSAEEAVASMSGGREDLLPKIIHYGGHQPPTPPSPLTGSGLRESKGTLPVVNGDGGGARRRARVEYERDMGSPPLGSGPEARRGQFGQGRDSPGEQRSKKDEFLTLCARAWDLFHS